MKKIILLVAIVSATLVEAQPYEYRVVRSRRLEHPELYIHHERSWTDYGLRPMVVPVTAGAVNVVSYDYGPRYGTIATLQPVTPVVQPVVTQTVRMPTYPYAVEAPVAPVVTTQTVVPPPPPPVSSTTTVVTTTPVDKTILGVNILGLKVGIGL